MATFPFELVSPDKLLFSGPAQAVVVPGDEGDFQVLADHAPLLTSVRPGVVAIDDAAGRHHRDLRPRRLRRGQSARADPSGGDRHPVRGSERRPARPGDQERRGGSRRRGEDQKRVAQEKLDRLRELKDSMKL